MIYFPTNWGAKEPQNLPNHRVGKVLLIQMELSGWDMQRTYKVFPQAPFCVQVWVSMLHSLLV